MFITEKGRVIPWQTLASLPFDVTPVERDASKHSTTSDSQEETCCFALKDFLQYFPTVTVTRYCVSKTMHDLLKLAKPFPSLEMILELVLSASATANQEHHQVSHYKGADLHYRQSSVVTAM